MRLPLLILHILGGTIGLLSGTFAISVRKGSRLHRASGNVFTIAMLTLASSGLRTQITTKLSQVSNTAQPLTRFRKKIYVGGSGTDFQSNSPGSDGSIRRSETMTRNC
jgi:hypothetical protein